MPASGEQLGAAAARRLILIDDRDDAYLRQPPQGIGIAGGCSRPDQ